MKSGEVHYFRVLLHGVVPYIFGCLILSSTAIAQSRSSLARDVREIQASVAEIHRAVKQVNRNLIRSQESNFSELKTELSAKLTELSTRLQTIQEQQNRKVDSNQMYCLVNPTGSGIQDPYIIYCYFAGAPEFRFVITLTEIQAQGWHLTSTTAFDTALILSIYSKYVE